MLPNFDTLVTAPLLRTFLFMLGTSTGVWVHFEKVQGDLFKYRLCLEGASLEVSKHFRCWAERCTLDFSILDTSLNLLVITHLHLEEARFEYHYVAQQDTLPKKITPFVIQRLTVHNSEVYFIDHTRGQPLSFKIHVETYHCESLHSHSLLFDAMFKGTMQGQLEQSPLITAYRQVDQRCMAQWTIHNLPVRRLSRFVQGQLDLLEQSSLDLLITHTWHTDQEYFTLQVHVWIRDLVKLKPLLLLPTGSQKLVEALQRLINQPIETLPLRFVFKVRKTDFLQLTRIDAPAILLAFSEALIQAIMERSLHNYDQLLEMSQLSLDTFLELKQLFDKY